MDFQARFSSLIQEFEKAFPSFLPQAKNTSAITKLNDAIRYSALAPGKRLRPFLLLETARVFGGDKAQAMAAAAAIECVHVYSLVHDDLPAMDDDDERRGQPTLHKKYDEATAILAGDALLTLAFEILAKSAPRLIAPLAQAAGWNGMVGGQMMDLEAEHRTLTLEEIILLQQKKTGALFSFCTEAGALLGGATKAEQAALRAYTEALGLLFQVTDDMLDYEGNSATLGKAAKKDAAAGKATTVSLLGIDGARKFAAEQMGKAKAALNALTGRDCGMLAELIDYIFTRQK